MPSEPAQPQPGSHANPREEGAVLIVVMMMLLTISATAVYTVSNTTSELRGASAMRSSYQAEAMSVAMVDGVLAWTDEVSAQGLQDKITANTLAQMSTDRAAGQTASTGVLNLTGVEAMNLAPGQEGIRLGPSEIVSASGSSLVAVDADSFNRATPSKFVGFADVYDVQRSTFPTPGARSDGYGSVTYMQIVISGRAVTELTSQSGVATSVLDAHRTQATARAVAIVGPVTR